MTVSCLKAVTSLTIRPKNPDQAINSGAQKCADEQKVGRFQIIRSKKFEIAINTLFLLRILMPETSPQARSLHCDTMQADTALGSLLQPELS
jgi:hypothetical protein